jgi:hypothetical protein
MGVDGKDVYGERTSRGRMTGNTSKSTNEVMVCKVLDEVELGSAAGQGTVAAVERGKSPDHTTAASSEVCPRHSAFLFSKSTNEGGCLWHAKKQNNKHAVETPAHACS